MADRYFNHIVGCLEASIKTAEDGVDCRISAVTVQGAVDLLKEQNERIEKMRSLLGEADEEIGRLKEIAKNGNGFIEKCDSRTAQMFSH